MLYDMPVSCIWGTHSIMCHQKWAATWLKVNSALQIMYILISNCMHNLRCGGNKGAFSESRLFPEVRTTIATLKKSGTCPSQSSSSTISPTQGQCYEASCSGSGIFRHCRYDRPGELRSLWCDRMEPESALDAKAVQQVQANIIMFCAIDLNGRLFFGHKLTSVQRHISLEHAQSRWKDNC